MRRTAARNSARAQKRFPACMLMTCALSTGIIALPAAAQSDAPTAAAVTGVEHTFSGGGAAGEPVLRVRIALDRSRLTVADRLVLTLRAESDQDATITLPDVAETLGDFTVVSAEASSAATPSGQPIKSLRIVLEPFLSGKKTIPPLTFKASLGKNSIKTTTIASTPLNVPVSDVLTLSKEEAANPPLAPAKAPMDLVDSERGHWLAITLGSVAGFGYLGAFGGAWLAARRRRIALDPVGLFRADIHAARELLRTQHENSAGAAMGRIAMGLRSYLTHQAMIPAIGASGPELARLVRDASSLDNATRARTERLVLDLDAARFAPGLQSPEYAARMVEEAEAVLAATLLPPAPREGVAA